MVQVPTRRLISRQPAATDNPPDAQAKDQAMLTAAHTSPQPDEPDLDSPPPDLEIPPDDQQVELETPEGDWAVANASSDQARGSAPPVTNPPAATAEPRRRRGRPPGSANKPNAEKLEGGARVIKTVDHKDLQRANAAIDQLRPVLDTAETMLASVPAGAHHAGLRKAARGAVDQAKKQIATATVMRDQIVATLAERERERERDRVERERARRLPLFTAIGEKAVDRFGFTRELVDEIEKLLGDLSPEQCADFIRRALLAADSNIAGAGLMAAAPSGADPTA